MHLIDIGYDFFIMCFDVLKDYHHALMDGPWFMGEQYLTRVGMGGGSPPTYCQNIDHGDLDPFRTITYRILSSRVSQTHEQ